MRRLRSSLAKCEIVEARCTIWTKDVLEEEAGEEIRSSWRIERRLHREVCPCLLPVRDRLRSSLAKMNMNKGNWGEKCKACLQKLFRKMMGWKNKVPERPRPVEGKARRVEEDKEMKEKGLEPQGQGRPGSRAQRPGRQERRASRQGRQGRGAQRPGRQGRRAQGPGEQGRRAQRQRRPGRRAQRHGRQGSRGKWGGKRGEWWPRWLTKGLTKMEWLSGPSKECPRWPKGNWSSWRQWQWWGGLRSWTRPVHNLQAQIDNWEAEEGMFRNMVFARLAEARSSTAYTSNKGVSILILNLKKFSEVGKLEQNQTWKH